MVRQTVLCTIAVGLVLTGASCADQGTPSREELVARFQEPDASDQRLSAEEARCWADATFAVLTPDEIDAVAAGRDNALKPERRQQWGEALKACVLQSSPAGAGSPAPATPTSVPPTQGASP